MNRKERRAAKAAAAEAPSAPAQLFSQALRLHQSGQLGEAESLYRRVLAADPKHLDSLHLLGVVAQQSGRFEESVALIGRAIALNGRVSSFHNNIAEALRALGRLDEAASHLRKALALEPGAAETHMNLANVLRQQHKWEEAEAEYRHALSLKPDHPDTLMNYGVLLMDRGRLEEAVTHCERAVALRPDYHSAHLNLGIALQQQGRTEAAVQHYERALALRPDYVLAHMNLGDVFFDEGKLDAAERSYVQALRVTGRLRPDLGPGGDPAGLIGSLSTTRPLYPVEDKSLMSLVRLYCWRIPAVKWGALCTAALKYEGLSAPSRYELLVRKAIQQWMARDYDGLRATLDQSAPLSDAIGATNNKNVKNSRAYAGFMRNLLAYVGGHPGVRDAEFGQSPLRLIGDSHALAYDGVGVVLNGMRYTGQAHLVMGGKAWHLAAPANNRYKWLFTRILDDVPARSTVVCSFGEIDCRIDEGIIPHYRRRGGDLGQLIAAEVDAFVRYVAAAADAREVKVRFLAVPAPNVPLLRQRPGGLSTDDVDLLVRTTKLFNQALERAAIRSGHALVDVYALSAGPDGTATGERHIDDYHLQPDALRLALR